MSYAAEQTAIVTFFVNGFKKPDNSPWFEVEYPNHPLGFSNKAATKIWGRFSVAHAKKMGREVGAGSSRIPGEITLQIFLPIGSGTMLAKQAGDQIAQFMQWRDITLADGIIRLREVSVRNVGADDTGTERVNVEIPFFRDEFA